MTMFINFFDSRNSLRHMKYIRLSEKFLCLSKETIDARYFFYIIFIELCMIHSAMIEQQKYLQ